MKPLLLAVLAAASLATATVSPAVADPISPKGMWDTYKPGK